MNIAWYFTTHYTYHISTFIWLNTWAKYLLFNGSLNGESAPGLWHLGVIKLDSDQESWFGRVIFWLEYRASYTESPFFKSLEFSTEDMSKTFCLKCRLFPGLFQWSISSSIKSSFQAFSRILALIGKMWPSVVKIYLSPSLPWIGFSVSNSRYKYLHVSDRKNDSWRSSKVLSSTLWTVAYPHSTLV